MSEMQCNANKLQTKLAINEYLLKTELIQPHIDLIFDNILTFCERIRI